jgi:hypothetical protein
MRKYLKSTDTSNHLENKDISSDEDYNNKPKIAKEARIDELSDDSEIEELNKKSKSHLSKNCLMRMNRRMNRQKI